MIYELSKKTLFGYKDVAEFDVYHHAIVSESYVIWIWCSISYLNNAVGLMFKRFSLAG